MTALPLDRDAGGQRYPGLDVMAQSRHWDAATVGVVAQRLGRPADLRYFTQAEVVTASALCDQLLGQHEEPRVPVVNLIDARLAERQTDGWRYADMPHDDDAWRASLAALDQESRDQHGCSFHELDMDAQVAVLRGIQGLGLQEWHGMPAAHVWGLWLRYSCTAFYSHPWAWQEIGFAGPAYPRGYKNLGVDALEPFEVADARPDLDPTRAGRSSTGSQDRT